MSHKRHGRVIQTSVRMKTTPMKAWEAWADPQKIANWFVDRAEGTATPGGTMKWFFDSFGYAMDVPIAEVEPGRLFVVSSGDQPGPDGLPYLMEITIEKDGGETVMHLVNSGFSDAPDKDEKARGVGSSAIPCARAVITSWCVQLAMTPARSATCLPPAAVDRSGSSPTFRRVAKCYVTPGRRYCCRGTRATRPSVSSRSRWVHSIRWRSIIRAGRRQARRRMPTSRRHG
jgi:uncharacterized protein YndB with AHSA1/START domain